MHPRHQEHHYDPYLGNEMQQYERQQYQVQQYEEHYYEQGQLQGDYTFSSISPAMREQARQASEKAKKILYVSSQYFSKFNAKNARKSMSTLTSKLKNKFRQKDDPRRVFDRFSNQIRRQKKKAQESGFDGDFDDDEDDWPAFSPEEGGFDGDNMYGGRLDGSYSCQYKTHNGWFDQNDPQLRREVKEAS